MIILFWVGIAWLAYVYIGYPCVLAFLALCRRMRLRTDATLPTVSVLISARNEEKDIRWKLQQTLAWDYPGDRLEVLVASDASTDDTDRIVESLNSSRVRLLRLERRRGKSVALNDLAQHARGELLFFTDANSSIEPHALRRMVRHFADPRVGCVTGEMDETGASAIADGARVYWGYEGIVKRLESALGCVLVCVGSIFCMRRTLYRPLTPDLANDLEIPLKLSHAGYLVLYEPAALSRERAAGSVKEEFARRRRICGQGLLGMWRLRHALGGMRGWQFISRKFLRWLLLIPLGLVLAATVSLRTEPWFLALTSAQAVFYALALVGGIQVVRGRPTPRVMSVPFYVLLVMIAGLVGLADTCFGRRFHVWESASLSRGRSLSRP